MTATNHHGTGGLSNTYLGTTAKLVNPSIPNYKLINTAGDGDLTDNIENVKFIFEQDTKKYIGGSQKYSR